MTIFRFWCIYLLIGTIIGYILVRRMQKNLTWLGLLGIIVCNTLLWPLNYALAIWECIFASKDFKKRHDEIQAELDKYLFEEDP